MEAGALLVAIIALATLAEWLLERFVARWVQGELMIWISAVLGVALCVLFGVDGLILLGLPEPMFAPWTGYIVTGIIVGAGSNKVHEVFKVA